MEKDLQHPPGPFQNLVMPFGLTNTLEMFPALVNDTLDQQM